MIEHLGQGGITIIPENMFVEERAVVLQRTVISAGPLVTGAEVVFVKDIAEDADRYVIGEIYAPTLMVDADGMDILLHWIRTYGISVPKEAGPVAPRALPDFASLSFDVFSIGAEGNRFMTFRRGHMEAAPAGEGGTVEYSGAVEEFEIDFDLAEPVEMRDAFEAMGYLKTRGYLEFNFSLRGSPAAVDIGRAAMSFVDAGTLFASGELVPLAANGGGGAPALDPGGLALKEAELWYADEGFTEKLIGHLAAVQGTSEAAVKLQAQALVMIQGAMMVAPEAVPQLLAATQAFLAKPESLAVTAGPAQPVPLAELFSEEAPEAVKRLGLGFAANQ